MLAKRGVPHEELPQKSQYVGNNVKSMHISVRDSLKNLRTDYIDILYVHYWDYTCSVEEVMNGLHTLVLDRKVLYLGISDTPAWIVSKANNYARMANKTPFVIYEGEWNIMMRDFERDILPMAVHEGEHFDRRLFDISDLMTFNRSCAGAMECACFWEDPDRC